METPKVGARCQLLEGQENYMPCEIRYANLNILIGRSPAFNPFHHSRASSKARFSCFTDLILKYVSSRQPMIRHPVPFRS